MNYFNELDYDIDKNGLPKEFTYPFYYIPQDVVILAAKEFYLQLEKLNLPFGKMFGILVVQDKNGKLGYLKTVSGKIPSIREENNYSNEPDDFVPPIANQSDLQSIHNQTKKDVAFLEKELIGLKEDIKYKHLLNELDQLVLQSKEDISKLKEELKTAKKNRDKKRNECKEKYSEDDLVYKNLNETLIKESLFLKHTLREKENDWNKKISDVKKQVQSFQIEINDLQEKQKQILQELQQYKLEQYHFLNTNGERKSLLEIFKDQKYKPPAGSGDCAAPKLLNYAFQNQLTPIAMGEFWWGKPHKALIRKHKEFYPSCTSRCKPILEHMLKGLNLQPNPMLINQASNKELQVVFEDEFLAIVNKPFGLLSVPGKNISDSVQARVAKLYPNYQGPFIVHRLDQSTSGLMIIAKTNNSHKKLQKLFINKEVKKTYVALLDGIISSKKGIIDLPLKLDFHNRPRQMVCYNTGKPSKTEYKVIKEVDGKTLIHFSPITGRTHQLRMHASHQKGLNTPILGDTLYGTRDKRLYLHAKSIVFTHPFTKNKIYFEIDEEF